MLSSSNFNMNLMELSDVADIEKINENTRVIDNGLVLNVGDSTGSGNDYVLNTGSLVLDSSNKGISFKFFADKNSTGPVTINTFYNLIKTNGNPVKVLKANAPYIITYDGGTNFFLASGGGDESELTSVGTDGSNVLAPNTFIGQDGEIHTGIMANIGQQTAKINCGVKTMISKGYHDGTGYIEANTLAAQTVATAAKTDIASGKTAIVNGVKLTGTATPETLGGKYYTSGTISLSNCNLQYIKYGDQNKYRVYAVNAAYWMTIPIDFSKLGFKPTHMRISGKYGRQGSSTDYFAYFEGHFNTNIPYRFFMYGGGGIKVFDSYVINYPDKMGDTDINYNGITYIPVTYFISEQSSFVNEYTLRLCDIKWEAWG